MNEVLNKMKKVTKSQPTETLKETAKKLMSDFRNGTSLSLDIVLDEIETRMSEDDFVKFCDEL